MKKILLLHGWNYRNYSGLTDSKDAWNNRGEFVSFLSKYFDIYKINFPGFCGETEPKKGWDLEDYAKYVKDYLDKNNLKPDYILGYSFGGAVGIMYNRLYDNAQKLILVSPAICRNFSKSKKFIKSPFIFNPIRSFIRDFYLIHFVKNKYMIYGTKFLRSSYQKIVRRNLLSEVIGINPSKLLIIYGGKDKMVKPDFVIDNLPISFCEKVHIIKDGGHNIGKTHYKEVISIIKKNVI